MCFFIFLSFFQYIFFIIFFNYIFSITLFINIFNYFASRKFFLAKIACLQQFHSFFTRKPSHEKLSANTLDIAVMA